jgi:hypothetical protein
MKKPGLVIFIILCLIIFFTTLTAGVLLTLRTVGWNDLLDQTQLQERLNNLSGYLNIISLIPGTRETFTVDELRQLDLSDVRAVEIAGVSETITVYSAGDTASARLHGTYRSFSPVVWVTEKQGDTLKIHVEYARTGLFSNTLAYTIHIPSTYTGTVKVNSVSGKVILPDQDRLAWSDLSVNTVSGAISLAGGDLAALSCNSVSGHVDLAGATGTVQINTTSGNITVTYEQLRDSKFRSISGSVRLALPDTADCSIDFATISGQFTNQGLSISVQKQENRRLTGTIGQGQYRLDVNTTSGDLAMRVR